jgi:hypothetical protein
MNKVVEHRRGEIFDDNVSMQSTIHFHGSMDDRLHTNSSRGIGDSPASGFRGKNTQRNTLRAN